MYNISLLPSETFTILIYTPFILSAASHYSFLFNLLYHIYMQQISILQREF